MNRIIAAALAVAAFTGCGPGFNGTVSGYGLSVKDELFVTVTDNTGASQGAVLVLTDQPDFCPTLAATKAPANLSLAAFIMDRTVDGKYLAPDTGDYVVGAQSGGSTTGMFMHTDANGTNELPATNRTATSGRLTVTAFQAGNAMSGSFDGKFGAQNDAVSFSFNAHNCTIDTQTFMNGFLVGGGSYSQMVTQTQQCADYVACADRISTDHASVDAAYGYGGSCWSAGASVAASCTSACTSGLSSFRSAYPDYGC